VSLRRILTRRGGVSATARRPASPPVQAEGISFGAALDRADAAPGIESPITGAIRDFLILLTDLRAWGIDGMPSEVLEAVLDKTGLLARARGEQGSAGRGPRRQPARAGQRGPRVRGSGAPVPTGAGDLDAFLEQVSARGDADSIPDANERGLAE